MKIETNLYIHSVISKFAVYLQEVRNLIVELKVVMEPVFVVVFCYFSQQKQCLPTADFHLPLQGNKKCQYSPLRNQNTAEGRMDLPTFF